MWQLFLQLLLSVALLTPMTAIYEWSLQQRITLENINASYGSMPSFLNGRGFMTLVTGYSGVPSSVFVHTQDDGNLRHGQYIWSQQARLVAQGPGITPTDNFGKYLAGFNQTLIISAPTAGDRRGFAYVFNGTLRHWSQIQRLTALEGISGDLFGEYMSLHEDRLVISARGVTNYTGAVYVFERATGGVYWSRQGRLQPRDKYTGQNFGAKVDVRGTTVVVSGTYENDDGPTGTNGKPVGAFYTFQGSGGSWSQQQKLYSVEMASYKTYLANPSNVIKGLDVSLGYRYLGPSLAITRTQDILLGVTNLESSLTNRESLWVYTKSASVARWSLQQKLFYANDSTSELFQSSSVYYDGKNKLYLSLTEPNITAMYIFKTFGSGWSLQSKLLPYNVTIDGTSYNVSAMPSFGGDGSARPSLSSFYNPRAFGGTLVTTAGNEVQMRSEFRETSCLRIWMSDHFLDGWDSAVLTVRAPDVTNDTFHPHCDQVDPFFVRYCPYDPEDEGVYIIKVFAATEARFYWEISWQVQEEATGKIYRGDFATKMHFRFDASAMTFSLVGSENLVDLQAPCYRCTQIALRRWAQMQTTGDVGFWPLVVTGAPYYISDYDGRLLYATGKVCDGVTTYECYQRLSTGVYTLRLGGGLFGRITGFPYRNASWTGCGESGGDRDQLVFRIANGECIPLQKHHYSWRCDRPPSIDSGSYSGSKAPTASGTVAPTHSVYGEPYVKGRMYAHRVDPVMASHARDALELQTLTEVTTEQPLVDGTHVDSLQDSSLSLEDKIIKLRELEQRRRQEQVLASAVENDVNGMRRPGHQRADPNAKNNQNSKYPYPILHFR